MVIPVAKVKTLCSSSELTLVLASRRPELNKLTPADLKRFVIRARKLCDKSSDLGRSQARVKSREHGAGSVPTRTHLKSQVFADALLSFETRLAKLEVAAADAGAPAASKTKKIRNATHRATRATVRKGLAARKAE